MRFLLIDREFGSPLWVVSAKRVVGSWCRNNQGRTIDLAVLMLDAKIGATGVGRPDDEVEVWRFEITFEPCQKGNDVLFWLAYVNFGHLRGMAIDFMAKNNQEEAAIRARRQLGATSEMIELINFSIRHAEYR